MRIEEMNSEQLAELHMMRVAVGLPHEGIAGFTQQYEPYKEFLYDREPDELDVLNELWKNDGKDAVLLQLHQWMDDVLEWDESPHD